MIEDEAKYLRISLYKLYYFDNLDDFTGLSEVELISLKQEYSESDIAWIVKSVGWAIKNPKFDFFSLLPNLKFNNNEIYKYLCKLDVSLRKLDI